MSGIVWNDDFIAYSLVFGSKDTDEDKLRAYVREFTGTRINELFFCPNTRVTNYRGSAWDFVAREYDPTHPDSRFEMQDPRDKKSLPYFYSLDQKGLNQYSIWVDECRRCGISPWMSMRVNDVHNMFNESHPDNSNFWLNHPEYRRAEYRFQECGGTDNNGVRQFSLQLYRALDYAHPEVRMHQMRLVKELLELYDMDGLEMDFLRFPTCFRPGFEEAGVEIMNDFIREVRGQLNDWEKQRGHPIHLGARVPMDPNTALAFGLDVHEWARSGWVDRITPMKRDRGHASVTPYVLWKKLLDGMDVILCGGVDICRTANYSQPYMRALANSLLTQGVDRLYIFNGLNQFFFKYYIERQVTQCEEDIIEDFRTLIREIDEVAELSNTKSKHRRYVFQDPRVDSDFGSGEIPAVLLPLHIPPKTQKDIRIHLGQIGNEPIQILLGITDFAGNPGFTVRLNGSVCPYVGPYEQSLFPNPGHSLCRYTVSAGAAHDGYNMLEIFNRDTERQLDWIEVEVSGDQQNG